MGITALKAPPSLVLCSASAFGGMYQPATGACRQLHITVSIRAIRLLEGLIRAKCNRLRDKAVSGHPFPPRSQLAQCLSVLYRHVTEHSFALKNSDGIPHQKIVGDKTRKTE
jgi:hypothetical protein